MSVLEKTSASDILTQKAILKRVDRRYGRGLSTKLVLHLFALASELNLDIDLNTVNEISEKTPNLCRLAPAGKHTCRICGRRAAYTPVIHGLTKKD
jgi:dihydroxy-acid dehydratase